MSKTVKVKVTCPVRRDLPGFWSAGRFFEGGTHEIEVDEATALTLLAEVEAKVSILKVEVLPVLPDPEPEPARPSPQPKPKGR